VRWTLASRGNVGARMIADRHYNRRKVGASGFAPPGQIVVLRCERALWISIWSRPEYVDHRWPGAWLNSTFRNEGAGLSSELILEACAATCSVWGAPPEIDTPPVVGIGPSRAPVSLISFVDPSKVRHKRDPGRCYLRAGFDRIGETKGGHGRPPLIVFGLASAKCPPPSAPLGAQFSLFRSEALT
jgi:hypothetical protein